MLPSIPVSPLIQQSLSCASKLADLTQSSPSSEAAITQHRNRLDQLTQQMHGVRGVLFHQWHPETLAKQIVAVDAQLFNNTTTHDRLDDFHQYLMHSLAHQLIITNSYAAFDHAVRLAHALHHYRDWNGLMAVVRCLALPSVQRLSTSSASPLCHDFPWVHHDDATTTTTNDTSFAAYRQALRRSLLPLRPYRLDPHDRRRWSDSIKKSSMETTTTTTNNTTNTATTATTTTTTTSTTTSTSILVAIPWLPPLVEAESEPDRALLITLCRSNRWPNQVDIARALLLPSTPPSSPAATTMLFSSSSQSNTNLTANSNLPPILPPHSIIDLLDLGPGDLILQHWLVSRPYLTTEQLGLESQLVESKATTTTIAVESVVQPQPQQLQLQQQQHQHQQDYDDDQDWRAQTIPYDDEEEDEVDTKQQVLNVASSIPMSVTATTIDLSQLDQQKLGNSVMYDGDGDDVSDDDDDLVMEQHIIEEPTTEEPTIKQHAIELPVIEEHILEESTTEEHIIAEPTIEEHIIAEPTIEEHIIAEPTIEDITIAEHAIEEATIEKHVIAEPTIEEHNVDEPVIEDTTSEQPTIEHSTTQQLTDQPVTEHPIFEQDDTQQQKDSIADASLSQRSAAPSAAPSVAEVEIALIDESAHDADSEQWTGYPGPPEEDDNEDDEIWTGYPEPTPSEASEEEWKGYHATSEEAKWQAETILKVQQQEWQGYTLETLDEDELDSSTMMNGEFVKSRHARECVTPPFGQPC